MAMDGYGYGILAWAGRSRYILLIWFHTKEHRDVQKEVWNSQEQGFALMCFERGLRFWEVKGSSKESICVSGHFMARSVTPKWKIKKGNPFNRHLQLQGNCTRLPRCCHHLFLLFSDVTWFICFQRFKLSKIYDLIPISTSTKFTPFISFQARRWWWICWLFVQKIHQPLCWGGGTWYIYLLLRCGSFVGSVEFQDRKREYLHTLIHWQIPDVVATKAKDSIPYTVPVGKLTKLFEVFLLLNTIKEYDNGGFSLTRGYLDLKIHIPGFAFGFHRVDVDDTTSWLVFPWVLTKYSK